MCVIAVSIFTLWLLLQVVGQGLIETLEEGLGSEFTPEVKEAYLAFYGIVTNNMKEGLSEALEAAEEL